MSSTTARLGLYKPADNGAENINVTTDLNNNLDALDAKIGAFPCTSGNRPLVPFDGMMIRETDTGKVYIYNGTALSWQQMLFHTANYDQNITLPGTAQRIRIGGTTQAGAFAAMRALAGDAILTGAVTADTQPRIYIGADGSIDWSTGAAVADVSMYRDSSSTLGVGPNLLVEGDIIVGDTAYTEFLEVGSGDILLGSAKQRSRLSNSVTVSNTTTETMLAEQTINANDMIVGAVYRIKAWGTCQVTGTPTITFRGKLGSTTVVSFPAITARSAMNDGCWRIEYLLACTTAGAGGAVVAMLEAQHNFLGTSTTYTPLGPQTAAPVSRDTTVTADMEITVQWSAASASNSIVCRGFFAERVA